MLRAVRSPSGSFQPGGDGAPREQRGTWQGYASGALKVAGEFRSSGPLLQSSVQSLENKGRVAGHDFPKRCSAHGQPCTWTRFLGNQEVVVKNLGSPTVENLPGLAGMSITHVGCSGLALQPGGPGHGVCEQVRSFRVAKPAAYNTRPCAMTPLSMEMAVNAPCRWCWW
jgi:hypothetical protein